MAFQRILTIQDISCLGQCSLTVALPVISACGVETCVLPSAVLSTHTGGFTGYTFRDLTEDIPPIVAHWKKEQILFDAIYTGYLGSEKQIGYVKNAMQTLGKPGSLRIVDPAMADNGKLYAGFSDGFVSAMRTLCESADIILPNITEACFMTGAAYREDYDRSYTDELMERLLGMGVRTVILTGVGYAPGETGVLVCTGKEKFHYRHRRIARSCHGTGDLYASAFVGCLMNGLAVETAAGIAADFTVRCIENTMDDPDHWYGSRFESVLPELMEMLKKAKEALD